ncbi:MAG: site-specific DNA-methyltransferase [Marinospirillum sp.]|uniref:site-specific DNA-methyltransferase n=1 Tax=Marinospirillum sp. TaxID=2183934 RepID=UPI0019E7F07E|nr:site-specific DNA-methyltransferase [Marinospirillum sp.]MBE0507529.1 site-specific DNA-methyltransferase [Marinospirillum sp.]
MATGVLGKEKLGEAATSAGEARCEPWALPDRSEMAVLSYANKVNDRKILEKLDQKYLLIKNNPREIEHIPLDSFILADNFFGLNKLLENYSGKIRLIYLDPPYGTGMDFQSRNLEHAYQDSFGTASWVEMIRRRLIIMRELLSSDGSIYIHIGHQMLFHLKIIMDEVFGPENFRNLITRRKCSSKNSTRKQYPNLHDYILFYSKSSKWIFNQPKTPATEQWIEKEYPKSDNKGRYKLVPIHAPGTRNGETGKEWRGMLPPPGKHWQFTPAKLDEFDKNGEIHWSKTGNPRRKIYLEKNKAVPITDVWCQYKDAHHQSKMITGYPTEKNLEMLKMIVQASTNEGDIVLDPFCGSGTTIHAARDLDRHWIGIDQSFTAAKATIKRLKYGLERMGDYVNKSKDTGQGAFKREDALDSNALNFVVDNDVYLKHKNLVNEISNT